MAELRRLAAAILLVVTGCAPGPPAPADRYDREGAITFVDGPDTSHGRQFEQLVTEWNRSRGNDEHVTFVELPYSTDEHRAQLRARAQDLANADPEENRSHCYDVMTMDVIWTAEFAERGYLVPLEAGEFGTDRFLREPVDAATVRGQLWAIPMRVDTGLLYYRKDLVRDPPRTWAELAETARGRQAGMDGYVGQFARYEGLTVNAIEAIWGAGGDVLAEDGSVRVGSAEARDGVKLLARGVDEGWIPRAALEYTEEQSREAFQQGSALFLRNWPYVYRLLADEKSPVADKFDVAPLPGPNALGGWNLGISSCSTHRKTARDFIRFLTSEENQRRLFVTAGAGPTIASLYEDEELRAKIPYLDVLRESVQNSRKRPTVPYYEDVSDAIQEHVGDALTELDAADDRIADLEERLVAIAGSR